MEKEIGIWNDAVVIDRNEILMDTAVVAIETFQNLCFVLNIVSTCMHRVYPCDPSCKGLKPVSSICSWERRPPPVDLRFACNISSTLHQMQFTSQT